MTNEQFNPMPQTQDPPWLNTIRKHLHDLPDDLAVAVARGHLLLEQHLTDLILVYARGSADVSEARLTFTQKVALAKAFVRSDFPAEFWGFVKILNQLRNDFAHELEPKKLPEHVEALRKMASEHRREIYVPDHTDLLWMFETPAGAVKMMSAYWAGVLGRTHSRIRAQLKEKAVKKV